MMVYFLKYSLQLAVIFHYFGKSGDYRVNVSDTSMDVRDYRVNRRDYRVDRRDSRVNRSDYRKNRRDSKKIKRRIGRFIGINLQKSSQDSGYRSGRGFS